MTEKGLTLVEVLIAMGISILVGALLMVIIINSAGLSTKQSSVLTEGLNINDALSKLRNTIKDANAVAASYTSGLTTFTSSSTQLVLKISSIDSSNNIITDTFDHFVFFQDQNKLRLQTFPSQFSFRKAQDQIFSTSLDSLLFQYLNSAALPVEVIPTAAAKIRITLTLKQNTATSEANLRND